MPAFTVRSGVAKDAAAVARLANALNMEMDGTKGPFDELVILRDGFGTNPAFKLLVAEAEDRLVGYALYSDYYNTDFAHRGYWLQDLYIAPAFRKTGVGEALMRELAQRAVSERRGTIAWGVYTSNEGARRFYRKIGAKDPEAKVLELNGDALWALAGRGLARAPR